MVGLLLEKHDSSRGQVEAFIATSLPNMIVDFVRKTYLYRDGGVRMTLATYSLDSPITQSDGSETSLSEQLVGVSPTPELEFLKLKVVSLLKLLPPREALVVRKRYIDDWTVEEIAVELGLTGVSVYSRLNSGIAQLRVLMRSGLHQRVLRRLARKSKVVKIPRKVRVKHKHETLTPEARRLRAIKAVQVRWSHSRILESSLGQ
jgi:RNA polymerase sigma factor (sigma-70 family)